MLNIYAFAGALFVTVLGMSMLTHYRHWRSFLGGLLFIAGSLPLIYQQVLIQKMREKPPATTLAQISLDELREVKLEFEDRSSQSFLVHRSETEKMVEASKTLHYEPGINPHNGGAAAKVRRITVWAAEATGPHWWSTPNLKSDRDAKNGARVYEFFDLKSSWTAPSKHQ